MSFEYHNEVVDILDFTMLYPPEGDSSVLEVLGSNNEAFLHVTLAPDETLIFAFLSGKPTCLSEQQLQIITEKAKENLTLTDSSMFE